jgi:hypothetical protein
MADLLPPGADGIGEIETNWNVGVATDSRLTEIYEFWRSRCRDGVLPSRADIDPTRLAPRLLPFLFLVEVLEDPRDFRFRLAGTHFRDITGAEATGRRIAEVFPPGFADEVRYHWDSCVERKAPKLGSGNLWVPDRNHIRWEGIVLPLSPDGDCVNMLLGAVIFRL